jgi:hypothetical protein
MRRTLESDYSYYKRTRRKPVLRKMRKTWIECTWIDRDYFVNVFADEDETVHAYSVTTRSKRFRPTFRPPGGYLVERNRLERFVHFPRIKIRLNPKVRLGKTDFQALGPPGRAGAFIGAHNRHYFEVYYFGNPGNYQLFVYSINFAGYDRGKVWDERLANLWRGFSDSNADLPSFSEEAVPLWYEEFRKQARVNTYTVLGPELRLENYPCFAAPPKIHRTLFGPNYVRTRTVT